jgi:hypothetical protein
MGVGRSVRTRKSTASVLILIGAPIWLLGNLAFAQSPPKHSDWPAMPAEDPPVTKRLWPPPAPPRPAPPATSKEGDPTPDDEDLANDRAVKDAPPAAPTAPAAPRGEAPPAPIDDPNQVTAPPPAPSVAPAQQPAPVPPPNGVYVELRSADAGMRIDQLTPAGQSWPACGVPCRRVLQRNLTYVIESNDAPPTLPFLLPDNTNHLTLDVHPGSQTQSNVGTLLAIAGGVVALIGFVRLATGGNSPSSDHTGLELLAGGAVTGITGLVLYRMSRTTVTSSNGMTFGEQRERDGDAPKRPASSIALTAQGLMF